MTSLPFALAEEEEERQNFRIILTCFQNYKRFSYARVNKTETYLNSLDKSHQDMLTKYRAHLVKIRDCIDSNHRVLQQMIQNAHQLFPDNNTMTTKNEDSHVAKLRLQDLENVQTTLKQIARDWSTDGEAERQQCYQPIIDEVLIYFDPKTCIAQEVKILVPGAGLGRLLYELALKGYNCEGNEVSLFMLIASNFVLNLVEEQNQFTIYPWVHQYVNNLNRNDQVAPVSFPDTSPKKSDIKGVLKMAAGDFTKYVENNEWDCIATCFFIDCANNVIEFIDAIYRLLKPGGIWINLGPLLYHYSDVPGEQSIEPTFEDLLSVMKNIGFKLIKYKTDIRTKYAQNPRSMLKTEYESIFWVCMKPLHIDNDWFLQ